MGNDLLTQDMIYTGVSSLIFTEILKEPSIQMYSPF